MPNTLHIMAPGTFVDAGGRSHTLKENQTNPGYPWIDQNDLPYSPKGEPFLLVGDPVGGNQKTNYILIKRVESESEAGESQHQGWLANYDEALGQMMAALASGPSPKEVPAIIDVLEAVQILSRASAELHHQG